MVVNQSIGDPILDDCLSTLKTDYKKDKMITEITIILVIIKRFREPILWQSPKLWILYRMITD